MSVFLRCFRFLLITVIFGSVLIAAPSQKGKTKKAKKTKQAKVKVVDFQQKYMIPQVDPNRSFTKLLLSHKSLSLNTLPTHISHSKGLYYVLDGSGNKVILTIDPRIQSLVEKEVKSAKAHTTAVVLMNVEDGRILAFAGSSVSVPNPVLHTGYKVASLFKIVTAAAAVDFAKVELSRTVNFRGGLYELSLLNYKPDPTKDRKFMSLEEGLARSINPLFARIALQFLDHKLLAFYSDRFGFNWKFPSDFDLPISRGVVPSDSYDLARTSAGFGSIFLTPVHAAAMIGAIGNSGFLMVPKIIDKVISKEGRIMYTFRPTVASKVVTSESAYKLLHSMVSTHTIGTASRSFANSEVRYQVSGKTGTLSIENPKGLLVSYAGVGPIHHPKYALAVFVVSPRNFASRATSIARRIFEGLLYGN